MCVLDSNKSEIKRDEKGCERFKEWASISLHKKNSCFCSGFPWADSLVEQVVKDKCSMR